MFQPRLSATISLEDMAKCYLTSAIPYVNAKPHIGWAYEIIQADTIARFRKLLGDEVLYLCGSDENSLKNVQAAEKKNLPIQQFVDTYSKYFQDLAKNLNVQFDIFQRGSNSQHHQASQKLWELCALTGDIYKKKYTGLYCVGCEMFYERSELNENGECFEHPGKKLDEVEEENYFFKLSKYQHKLIELLESGKLEIVPQFRRNEMLSFLKGGLEDISISRSNTRARNWGVTVPGDDSQKMYVWFDALNIYQSGIGFAHDEQQYKQWWPADVHAIGKGIIRFHAIYWPAFLMSAKLPLPKKLFVHEYITVNGQKMSKSLGNVIDPNDIITAFGADALRYYLLAKLSPFSDGDFSEEKFKQTYNADLANGLGNLVARVAKLSEKAGIVFNPEDYAPLKLDQTVQKQLEKFHFNRALEHIWGSDMKWGLRWLDQEINKEQPWTIKDKKKLENLLVHLFIFNIRDIAFNLKPFLPETADRILKQFSGEVKSQQPLFPRIT